MKKLALPESKAVTEVRTWRHKLQKRADKVGWKEYLKNLNKRPTILTRKQDQVVREKPAKKYHA